MVSRNKILEKSKGVAMAIKKPSKIWDIVLMVMRFCVWGLINHINLHAKNQWNLPHGFKDRHIATAMATNIRDVTHWMDTSNVAARHYWLLGYCDIIVQKWVTSLCSHAWRRVKWHHGRTLRTWFVIESVVDGPQKSIATFWKWGNTSNLITIQEKTQAGSLRHFFVC